METATVKQGNFIFVFWDTFEDYSTPFELAELGLYRNHKFQCMHKVRKFFFALSLSSLTPDLYQCQFLEETNGVI